MELLHPSTGVQIHSHVLVNRVPIVLTSASASSTTTLSLDQWNMQGLHVLVMFVGSVFEPKIAFSQTSINFRRVLLGRGQKEVLELVNSESMPFDFSFDKETYEATDQFLQGSGKGAAVRFEPDQGTLLPNSSISITVTYRPRAEAPVNYTAVCHVKHKPTPLTLNVKGEGYAVHEELHLQSADGSELPMSCRVRSFFQCDIVSIVCHMGGLALFCRYCAIWDVL
jgi:hypothetical protein